MRRVPRSSDDDAGFVELVVKVYFRGVNDKFPDGGVMSQHREAMKVGDTVRARRAAAPPPRSADLHPAAAAAQLEFQGPKGRYTYKGRGTFAVKLLASQARAAACVRAARYRPYLSCLWRRAGRRREAAQVHARGHDCGRHGHHAHAAGARRLWPWRVRARARS